MWSRTIRNTFLFNTICDLNIDCDFWKNERKFCTFNTKTKFKKNKFSLFRKDTNGGKPKKARSHGESSGSREYLDDIRDQHAQDVLEQQSNTDSEDHGDAFIIDDVGEENPTWNIPIRPPSCTPDIKTEDPPEIISPPIEPYNSDIGNTIRNRTNSFVRKCTSQQRQESASTSSNISFVKPLSKQQTNQPPQEFEHPFHHLQHSFPHFNRDIPSTSSRMRSDFDLCECKTDSDAMFLMSLLPDIQSLSRRDKGRIKIEFQKIIQNYLYPDDG